MGLMKDYQKELQMVLMRVLWKAVMMELKKVQ